MMRLPVCASGCKCINVSRVFTDSLSMLADTAAVTIRSSSMSVFGRMSRMTTQEFYMLYRKTWDEIVEVFKWTSVE